MDSTTSDPPKLVSEQALTDKLQPQEDRYHYAVAVFVEDGDGYIPAGEVAWSMHRPGADRMAQELLDAKHVPVDHVPSGWVKVVVTESREVSVARYYHRGHREQQLPVASVPVCPVCRTGPCEWHPVGPPEAGTVLSLLDRVDELEHTVVRLNEIIGEGPP